MNLPFRSGSFSVRRFMSGDQSVRTFLHRGTTNHRSGGGVPFVLQAGRSPTLHGSRVSTVPRFGRRLISGPTVSGPSWLSECTRSGGPSGNEG